MSLMYISGLVYGVNYYILGENNAINYLVEPKHIGVMIYWQLSCKTVVN